MGSLDSRCGAERDGTWRVEGAARQRQQQDPRRGFEVDKAERKEGNPEKGRYKYSPSLAHERREEGGQ